MKNWVKLLPAENVIMLEEYENKKRKQVSQMKSVMDYGMGILMLCAGIIFLFHDKLHLPLGDGPPTMLDRFFGGLCVFYGCWRIYRGYKKNYFS
ncbi:MAG: hypothetical protein QM764_15630 [Chitinophagaceae bacterium]